MHAATLRSRQRKMDASAARLLPDGAPSSSFTSPAAQSSSDGKAGRHPKRSPSSRPPPSSFAAQAHRRTARVRLVISSLAILLVLAYAARSGKLKGKRTHILPDGDEWVVSSLPGAYAVCAQEGVYTAGGDGGEQDQRCLVVDGKEVVELVSLEDVQRKYGDEDTLGPPIASADAQHVLDLPKGGLKVFHLQKGATITPGLVDSHGHLMMYGRWKSSVDLTGAPSMSDVVRRVREFVQADEALMADKERWIEGVGWDQNGWPSKAFPTWGDLEADPVLRGRKIILTRIDSHSLLCSREVLSLLSPLPASIEGGAIIRSTTGEPTGVLMDNAMKLVDAVRGAPGASELQGWLRKVTLDAVRTGLVGVHDAGTSLREIDFYKSQAAKGALPMRIYSMIACPDRAKYCGDAVAPARWEDYDGSYRVEGVKLVADGALGSWGAAMHEAYSDRKDGWRGILLADEERFPALVREWVEGGWQVNVHAIGDRANTLVLDSFAPFLPSPSSARNPHRLRLEHAQLLTPADVARVARSGTIASYQPTHATSDMAYVEEKIGSGRVQGAYAWRSVLDGGGRVALGSDFPIESIDPLKGFYAAVTRLDEQGDSPHGPGGWYPEERLTRAQALKGMTLDAAYASFSENITGSLVPGKRADYVVWDRDIMRCPPEEILQAKVIMTVINGQPVWGGP